MTLQVVLLFIITIICALKYFLMKNKDYWIKKGVPHLKPFPLFGNHKESILLKKHRTQVVEEICQLFPGEPYIGTLYGTKPALIVQDPDLIKLVLVKDFYYFSGREVTDFAHGEPITRNLFFNGGDQWKVQRQNLTPLFSPTKMKNMFYLINNCAHQLESLLEEEVRLLPHINARSLFARYTIDCITNCAFGVDSDTMNINGCKNSFMIIGQKIFDTSPLRGLKLHCRVIWPALFYGLKFSLFETKVYAFFRKLLIDTFKHRQTVESCRNDFVDLILTWKQNKYITGDSLSNAKNNEKKSVSLEVNDDLLIAQCVAIFSAGFETTATSLTFVIYELAKHQDVQEKVIKEVDSYFQKSNGVIEYDCINEMPYLESCIEEVFRLYPVLGLITREVMDDYTFPTGLRVQKGDIIHIPVNHIHQNPDYFPEPKQFRPERFYGEKRKNIKPFTFLPFGEGPRMCIGLRFAKMPMHAGLMTIFKNYRVELAQDMPRSVKFETTSIVITPASEIKIKFIPRKDE